MTDKERQTYTREVQIKKQRHSTASVHPPMFPTNIKKIQVQLTIAHSPFSPSVGYAPFQHPHSYQWY